jgi:spore germination cell wall hydrolase CwlJ-like protein
MRLFSFPLSLGDRLARHAAAIPVPVRVQGLVMRFLGWRFGTWQAVFGAAFLFGLCIGLQQAGMLPDLLRRLAASLDGRTDTAMAASAFSGPIPMADTPVVPRLSNVEQAVRRAAKTDLLASGGGTVRKFVLAEPEARTERDPGASLLLSSQAALSAPPGFAAAYIIPASTGSDAKATPATEVAQATPSPTPSAIAPQPIKSVQSGWSDLIRLAAMPDNDGSGRAKGETKLFGGLSEGEFRARELRCMAIAVYFEARDEPLRGQQAVAQVIMNRVKSGYYPATICGVVYQGQWNRNSCQFSFACDGQPDNPIEKPEWQRSLQVAKDVIAGRVYVSEVGDATHYHATYVKPDWRHEMRRVTTIGTHIFYKAPFISTQVADANGEILNAR